MSASIFCLEIIFFQNFLEPILSDGLLRRGHLILNLAVLLYCWDFLSRMNLLVCQMLFLMSSEMIDQSSQQIDVSWLYTFHNHKKIKMAVYFFDSKGTLFFRDKWKVKLQLCNWRPFVHEGTITWGVWFM